MIELLDGVVVVGNRYTRTIMSACERAFGELGLPVTLTSGLDGTHLPTSYHPQGRALDVRRWGVVNVDALIARLRALLPPYYDVVLEKDHIHIEADARKEFAQ